MAILGCVALGAVLLFLRIQVGVEAVVAVAVGVGDQFCLVELGRVVVVVSAGGFSKV
jgi:hypothetical protein